MGTVSKIIGVTATDINKIDGVSKGGISKIDGQTLAEARWITKWTTSGSDQTVKLWSQTGGTVEYSYDVDWGDGNTEASITAADKTHVYEDAGTYTVSITGQFGGLNMYRASQEERDTLVEFVNWGTSEVNGLYRYFYFCTKMVYSATDAPDLTSLTASNGTQMREMFRDCEDVVTLDLSGWTNTSNITSMIYAFYDCESLQTLNLTGWDTSNVSNLVSACYNAGDATDGCAFTMPNLNLSSCTTLNTLFYGARSGGGWTGAGGAVASSIDVSGWTLRAAGVTMSSTFNRLKKGGAGPTLTMDLSGWSNTSGITDLSNTFRDIGVTSINTTGWDTSNVTNMSGCFYYSDILTHVTGLDDWSADSVTTLAYFMSDCDVYNFGAANANFGTNFMDDNAGTCTSMISVAYRVGSTTPGTAPPNVANWDTSGVTSFWNIFESCNWTGGGNLDVSGWDVSSATGTGLADVFAYSPTTVADTSAWEIPSAVTSLVQFARASEITTIDFSDASCDLSGVTTCYVFGYQSKMTRFILHASSDLGACTNFGHFFPHSVYATVVTADYDALLLRLAATNTNASVTLYAGSSTYTGGGAVATARAALITLGWTITDGGIAP